MFKPILLNTPMTKATLDNRKTQTRRLNGLSKINEDPNRWNFDSLSIDGDDLIAWFENKITYEQVGIKSPYGAPGTILWVRETFYYVDGYPNKELYGYKADHDEEFIKNAHKVGIFTPSIHMPREAARLFLKVKSIRVERSQDITEKDALLEGLKNGWEPRMNGGYITAMSNFKDLWNSTIKKSDIDTYGWNANPFVWVIEFERVSE